MAISFSISPNSFSLVAIILLICNSVSSSQLAVGCYNAIFSFGDSNTDTGNVIRTPAGKDSRANNFPYGETFFHQPTGRFSDGRIILDFLADAFGLPFVRPFLEGQSEKLEFRKGVNFAVAGATVLDNHVYREMGLNVTWTNASLGVQMHWLKQLLPSLYPCSLDRKDALSKSLILLGEIGGADYNFPFYQRRSLEEVRPLVPKVISALSSAINELIELGARTVVVPGNFPIGCMALYLTLYPSPKEDYDPQNGCLKKFNEFAEYHNIQLSQELDRIRQRHPYASIIYGDYYNAIMSMIREPNAFGFGDRVPLAACCGAGGLYNVIDSAFCGLDPTATSCDDPSKYFCWDGIHFTEAANKIIADGLLNGPVAVPPISSTCPHLEHTMDQTKLEYLI